LRREHQRADRARNRYRNDRDQLREKIETRQDELDKARRAQDRQAAPFSRGIPPRPARRPGRKSGPGDGRKPHRRPPAEINDHYAAALPSACPDCGGRLAVTRQATQYQEDLPVVRRIVRAFHIERPGPHHLAQRFATHPAVEFPAVFTFLLDPEAIDATNWRAEHALRPAVVTRTVCGGNHSAQGAHTPEILASVLRTMPPRQLDAADPADTPTKPAADGGTSVT
jgi:hypothetical protein